MAFRLDKLTLKAQEAVARAQEIATDRGHAQIDPLHLLAALLGENDGIVGPILDRIGVNRGQLDKIVQAELGHFARVSGGAQPQLSPELNRVLELAAPARQGRYLLTARATCDGRSWSPTVSRRKVTVN